MGGGVLGLLLAFAGLRLLPSILPPARSLEELPNQARIGLNLHVLLYTFGVAVLTAILFGLFPALQASRTDLSETLKESGRSSRGVESHLARSALVIAEVGLSLLLVFGSLTLLQAFRKLLFTNPGFNPKNVLSLRVQLPESRYPDATQARPFFDRVIERVRALPGVSAASAVNFLPLSGWTDLTSFDIEGRPVPPPREQFNAHYRIIDDQYFRAMQIPVLEGRAFTEADGDTAPAVAIINYTLARRYWAGQNPIGQRVRLHLHAAKEIPWRPEAGDAWRTIVGVAGDVQNREWRNLNVGELYLPYRQVPTRLMSLVIRTSGDPHALAEPVRRVVASQDSRQTVTEVRTMGELLSAAIAPEQLDTVLLGLFAGLALLLAAIGIYGVISYSVQQRTHEIGIRLAIGAQPRDVVRLIVLDGARLALIGTALGLVATFSVTRVLAGSFFGIDSLNPLVMVLAVAVLLLMAFASCYVPARRATRVDPMQALRYE
jgi:putative ABC transport system permease protein